jgi:DNA polymerase-3 subunit alpha (Gram-positive type)
VADRYNVQAYPALYEQAIKQKQKVIYGYEFNMLDKQINVVINPIDAKLTDVEYVIFDIETTGLCNEYDEIIEFGAIKVKQNQIIDSIDFFIKPTKPVPLKITQLTNITNDQLKDAIGIKIGLKQIVN